MKARSVFNALVFFALLMLAAAGGGARAQRLDLDLTAIKTVPSYTDELTDETFLQQTEPYEETPANDQFLAYRVRLPIGWQRADDSFEQAKPDDIDEDSPEFVVDSELINLRNDGKGAPEAPGGGARNAVSHQVLIKVATFFGSANLDSTSRFEIRAIKLEHEITARNWFLQFIINNGYVLQGMTEYSDRRVEALYALVEGDYSYYVRSIVELNGPRVTLISYYLPDKYWNQDRALQERVIKSFRFTNPDKSKVELSRTYAFFDMLEFDYPSSWRLQTPELYSIEGMDAKLLYSLDQRTLAGEINIHIVSTELDTTLAQEVETLKDKIGEMGLRIGALIETPDKYKFRNHISFSRVEVYRANNKKGTLVDYEYWLAIMAESRYYYMVSMLTPGRNAEFRTWARNTEAFEAIIESFRPGEQ